jgi:hypothetical protein
MAADWDRGHVHGSIAEATGCVLPADDPLPDLLINRAEELGITAGDLRCWIYEELPQEHLRYSLLLDALGSWARRTGRIETPAPGEGGTAA